MTAQIIYGTDFKAKAEKERGESYTTGCSSLCIDAAKSTELLATVAPTPFRAPDTDPA